MWVAKHHQIFGWEDGWLVMSGWGIFFVFALIGVLYAFAERDRF